MIQWENWATNLTIVHPININTRQVLYFLSVQQWSKKHYYHLAIAFKNSSSRLSCQNRFFSWLISSKYLNHKWTPNLLYSIVLLFSYTAWFLPYTLHCIGDLQAALRIKRWIIFNLGCCLFWGKTKHMNRYIPVTRLQLDIQCDSVTLPDVFVHPKVDFDIFVCGRPFNLFNTRQWVATQKILRLWVFVPWLHTVCTRKQPNTLQNNSFFLCRYFALVWLFQQCTVFS